MTGSDLRGALPSLVSVKRLLFFLFVLAFTCGYFGYWIYVARKSESNSRCHGQCPHDKFCQELCLEKGYCPASLYDSVGPSVTQ